MRRLGVSAAALLLAPLLLAGEVEVYGRPLRGLSPARIADVAAHPERYRERPLRVSGAVAEASPSRLVVSDSGASLVIESDGSFALPAAPKGAKVTTEGKLASGAATLVATGIELRR